MTATNQQQRYLRKRGEEPLALYPFTETLAKRQDMYECDKDGRFIRDPSAPEGADRKIAELESELEKFRSSDSGTMLESLQAENAALKEEVESLRAENAALKGNAGSTGSVPQADQGNGRDVDVEAYVKDVTEKVDRMGSDKDSIRDFAQSEFGRELDRRWSWERLREKALELARKKYAQ